MPDPVGVMNPTYASDRRRKLHLRFRYRTRALLAFRAFERCGLSMSDPKVLDFGAADGLTLLELRRLFGGRGHFLGIEYSRELLDDAPPLPDNVALRQGDVTRLRDSVSPGSYDLVTSLAFLEHLSDPSTALQEAYRALKPGGLFLASVPSPAWDSISTRLGLVKGEHHESHLGKKGLVRLLEGNGLELVEFRRFMFAPISFLPYLLLPVPVRPALILDEIIHTVPPLRWLFVNQFVVGRKPDPTHRSERP